MLGGGGGETASVRSETSSTNTDNVSEIKEFKVKFVFVLTTLRLSMGPFRGRQTPTTGVWVVEGEAGDSSLLHWPFRNKANGYTHTPTHPLFFFNRK